MSQFLCMIIVPDTGAEQIAAVSPISKTWEDRAETAKRYLRLRAIRHSIDGGQILSDPAWDMLLDLFVAHVHGKKISVSSACLASRRPPTTSLRYLERMVEMDLIQREKDPSDHRRVFIRLTDIAFGAIADWIDALKDQLAAN